MSLTDTMLLEFKSKLSESIEEVNNAKLDLDLDFIFTESMSLDKYIDKQNVLNLRKLRLADMYEALISYSDSDILGNSGELMFLVKNDIKIKRNWRN